MLYTYKYPHPSVTTDCVILTFYEDALRILLIKRGIEPFKGEWALPGGFLKMDESAEECALRELWEETGVTGCKIKQFHTFTKPGRDPRERVITIAFYALMKWQQAKGADDAEYADWLPIDSLPPLAFDHKEIIDFALQAIRRDIYFEPVGFDLLNESFSMSELQKVYEAILGKEFDRRNFAKKMKHLDILEEIDPNETASPKEETNETLRKALPFLYRGEIKKSKISEPLKSRRDIKMSLRADKIMDDEISLSTPPMGEENETVELYLSENFKEAEPNCNDFHCCKPLELFEEKSLPRYSVKSQASEQRPRKGKWFRLNRKKYKKLKDDDIVEF